MAVRVYVEVYGCWLNKGEAEAFKSEVVRRGGVLVDSPSEADVVVVFTCAVRGETEAHMLTRIVRLSEEGARRGFRLVVAGCLVNVRPRTILEAAPGASLVEPDALDELVDAVLGGRRVVAEGGTRGGAGSCRGSRGA